MSNEIDVKPQPNSMELAILDIVKRKDIDPDRLEKFLDLQVKMQDRQNKESFQKALAMFQKECPVIKQTKHVSFKSVDYHYAPLDEIIFIIKPILAKHGLSYSFDTKKNDDKSNTLITTIYHESGHEKSFTHFYSPLHDDGRMNESQRSKSAITFAKRTALENALGIVTAGCDDDARRAVDNPVTEDQISVIVDYCVNTETEPKALLAHLKVSSLEDLTFNEAKTAIASLKRKRKILLDRKKTTDGKIEF